MKAPLQYIKELKDWMIDHYLYPELMELIPKYLTRQRIAKFDNLGEISHIMQRVASVLDNI